MESAFVSVLEPYESSPLLGQRQRLSLTDREGTALGGNHVALMLTLADGRRDVVMLRDPAVKPDQPIRVQCEPPVETDADTCVVRFTADGLFERAALCGARYVKAGAFVKRFEARQELVELSAEE